jgi:hypothetical protein
MSALTFCAGPGHHCFFSASAEIWPLAQGVLHTAGQVIRGWFYAPLPIPIGTRGDLCIIAEGVECRTAVPAFVSFQIGEMGLWRHEFTSVQSEIPTSWLPPAEPVTTEMLRRLFRAPTDRARVILDGEGGWRIASRN